MTRRCAYCQSKTRVTPVQGLGSTALKRALHSPLKAKVPPLCAATEQGRRATAAVKAQILLGVTP